MDSPPARGRRAASRCRSPLKRRFFSSARVGEVPRRALSRVLLFALSARLAWRCPPRSCTTSLSAKATSEAKAIGALVASGDAAALPLLQAMIDGEVQTVGDKTVLIVKGDKAIDAATGQAVSPLPENRDDVVVNNRLRRKLATAHRIVQAVVAGPRGAPGGGEGAPEQRGRRRCCPRSRGACQGVGSRDQEPADAHAGVGAAREPRPRDEARRDPRARAKRRRRDQDAAARRRSRRRTASSSRRTTRCASRPSARSRRSRDGSQRRHRGAHLQRHLARDDPAARRAGPCDHLRPDGRHQHGARRAHHDRRVRDVRRAEPLPPVRARRVRLVPAVARFPSRSSSAGSSAWCSSAR